MMKVQSEFERKKSGFYNDIEEEYKALRVPTLEDLQEAVWNIGINEASTLEVDALNAAWKEFQFNHKDLK